MTNYDHPLTQQCAVCSESINAINGRYCQLLKRYVQYELSTPPCGHNEAIKTK